MIEAIRWSPPNLRLIDQTRLPEQHVQVVEKIKLLATQLDCHVVDVCESPVLGPKGNREFLIHLQMEKPL